MHVPEAPMTLQLTLCQALHAKLLLTAPPPPLYPGAMCSSDCREEQRLLVTCPKSHRDLCMISLDTRPLDPGL